MKLWPEEQPTAGYWGLCFTAEEPNASISMVGNGTPPVLNLLYSTNANTWSIFTPGTTTVTLANVGDKVWLKAGPGGNAGTGSSISDRWTFSLTNHVAASGSIMSLLNGEQQTYEISQYYAFDAVFYNCTYLTHAPMLPATTLANGCYNFMFANCTSLVQAPALPATTLTQKCYRYMFAQCTSLSASPVLPATTLVPDCYQYMFQGCASLTSISASFTAWNYSGVSMSWVNGVASNGTFYCPTALGTNETIQRGSSYCPTNWTVVNTDA